MILDVANTVIVIDGKRTGRVQSFEMSASVSSRLWRARWSIEREDKIIDTGEGIVERVDVNSLAGQVPTQALHVYVRPTNE